MTTVKLLFDDKGRYHDDKEITEVVRELEKLLGPLISLSVVRADPQGGPYASHFTYYGVFRK